MSNKLYILVNKQLSNSQRAVQACHAAIEFQKKYGNEWKHESLVILGVPNQDEMDEWFYDLMNMKLLKVSPFLEPYYDHAVTAIACWGCDELVKDLQLL